MLGPTLLIFGSLGSSLGQREMLVGFGRPVRRADLDRTLFSERAELRGRSVFPPAAASIRVFEPQQPPALFLIDRGLGTSLVAFRRIAPNRGS